MEKGHPIEEVHLGGFEGGSVDSDGVVHRVHPDLWYQTWFGARINGEDNIHVS